MIYSSARLMLGFMVTTMFLSMWISNTATTAMMLPIVDAVADAINQRASVQLNTLNPIPEHETATHMEDEVQLHYTLVHRMHDEYFLQYDDKPTSQLTVNEMNELTVHSISSLNPGNDPDSMVAFLPNVRRNTMEKIPGEDPRSKVSAA